MKDYKVSLTVTESVGLTRNNEPVRIGLPFPKGVLQKGREICLLNEQSPVALQTAPLAFWPDGSIKWALLDFFVQCPANAKNKYTVAPLQNILSSRSIFPEKITLVEEDSIFSITTAQTTFIVPKDKLLPFSSVTIDGFEILSPVGSSIILRDVNNKEFLPAVESIAVEEKGPLRMTLVATGSFRDVHGIAQLNFKSRITFFAGMTAVKFTLQILNPKAAKHPGGIWDLGDPGSFLFKGLSLHLHPNENLQTIKWRSTLTEEDQTTQSKDWSIYQDSSGGNNWNSTNHVDANGNLTVSFQGFRTYENKSITHEGKRANPTVRYEGETFRVEGAVSQFWQNFPKAIRLKNKEFAIALFPEETVKPFELQGGEAKRHTIFLEFGKRTTESQIQYFLNPLQVVTDTDSLRSSGVFSHLIPRNVGDTDYYKYVKNAVEGPNSFFNKREVIDEFGWRNFGDLYADHEAVNHLGKNPLVSHYNNQYDFILGGLLQFLSTGDHRWFDLLQDAVCHMIDIDLYHTDNDKAAYNHGLFWHTAHYEDAATCTHRTYSRQHLYDKKAKYYGGGPSNEQNYTSGLLHYYYLTGDPEVRDAVLALANWVVAMDDGSRTILALLDKGPTGLASKTVSPDFHGPGRGAGNSINALVDAYRLSNQDKYIRKAEELIQRCIHPQDNIEELGLEEPEYRWSYLVFLQILVKYLYLKEELKSFDYAYFYARDSLIHYVGWMAEYEKPYKELLHKVDIPTETWPAHDVRKSCIFYQTSQYVDTALKKIFIEKGEYYFKRCLDDLLSFDTAYLTRPMVILIVYGTIPVSFQEEHDQHIIKKHDFDFGVPVNFISQKKRVLNRVTPKEWLKKLKIKI